MAQSHELPAHALLQHFELHAHALLLMKAMRPVIKVVVRRCGRCPRAPPPPPQDAPGRCCISVPQIVLLKEQETTVVRV